jgi:putative membrane protein insertion efficiency factor
MGGNSTGARETLRPGPGASAFGAASSGPLIARFFIGLIRVYQRTLSPLLGNVCRFEPSCSRYAVACLEAHGALRGSLLSFLRLCKCHPFHPGGVDLPPPPP